MRLGRNVVACSLLLLLVGASALAGGGADQPALRLLYDQDSGTTQILVTEDDVAVAAVTVAGRQPEITSADGAAFFVPAAQLKLLLERAAAHPRSAAFLGTLLGPNAGRGIEEIRPGLLIGLSGGTITYCGTNTNTSKTDCIGTCACPNCVCSVTKPIATQEKAGLELLLTGTGGD